MSLFLTVTADDFGLSPEVNSAILTASSQGLLKSASLMVVMPYAKDAVEQAVSRAQTITFGLHFSLTSGRGVAPYDQIPLLIHPDGRFKRGFLGLVRLLHSPRKTEALAQIEIELNAQLQRFQSLLAPYPSLIADHIDSHQHIHSLPGIWEKVFRIGESLGWTVRFPREEISLARLRFRPSLWRTRNLAKREILSYALPSKRNGSSPAYFGILDSGHLDTQAFLEILNFIPELAQRKGFQHFEINLHPWRVQDAPYGEYLSQGDIQFGHSPWREKEWNTLARPEMILQKMEMLGIEAAPFHPRGL